MRFLYKIFENFTKSNLIFFTIILYLFPFGYWVLSLPHRNKSIDINSLYWAQLVDTLFISISAAGLAVLFGGSIAILTIHSSKKVADVLIFSMMVPLLLGFIARNYSWVGFLSYLQEEYGEIMFFSNILDSWSGIVIVMTTVFTPFCYFVISQKSNYIRVEHFEAGRTLGATDSRMMFVITLPILSGSGLIAFLLSLILGIGYFITPQLIGGGNFPFIGNGVLTLLNDIGDVAGASLLALYLLLTILIPITFMSILYLIKVKFFYNRK